MRILILTQNENYYLPQAIGKVCKELGEDVVCVVSAPAMSTHGGVVAGGLRHVRLFGLRGTAIMGYRMLMAKLRAHFCGSRIAERFYSLKHVASALGKPFHDIKKVNSPELHAIIDQYAPDLLVSMSCPQIIGKKVRERFPAGCINVHGAPLPRYRGLMPAFWALCNGETMTATTVHDLGAKLDDGAILLQRQVPISLEDTWSSLVHKTKEAGADALIQAVRQVRDGTVVRRPNPEEEATYFSFPTAKDRRRFVAAGRRFF
ncbi:MAG: formyltransferase family protein [Thermodesulfobacteriota bacterium]|nr:formyltransferase family protein [Thermodesulfobacteriota bacterium]